VRPLIEDKHVFILKISKVFLRKNIKNLTDQELLIRYCEDRDQQLLAVLFTRYTHMAYGVCLKYLNNPDEASEALLNIFEKLCSNIHRHEILNFPSWLYVITKNHCLMQLNHGKGMDGERESWYENHLAYMERVPYIHPLDEENYDNRDKLRICLKQLRQEQRKCIELFYFHKKSFLEISHVLNLDAMKVKSYLQNGKRNLKICLEQKHKNESAFNDTPSTV
jgi:RNA polymerase sigma-70 factor, ECF subfamily